MNIFLFLSTTAFGQEEISNIYVSPIKKSGNNTIRVKWFVEDIWSKEGVNIYRKVNDSDWEKILENPYMKSKEISELAIQKDSSLKDMENIANNISPEELVSFLWLGVFTKAIENNDFAEFLGILYYDKNVETGQTYQYKVEQIVNGTEVLIGISDPVEPDKPIKISPPKGIRVEPANEKANITWEPEPERYFSVDIYRSSSTDLEEIKITDYPILPTKGEKADGSISYPEFFVTDENVENDVTYKYRIVGNDFFGEESESSEIFEVTIKDLIPPPAPYNLYRQTDNFRTTLTWDMDESDELVGFNVYKSTDDSLYNKINAKLLPDSDTSYLDVVSRSGEYYYYVTSVDKEGNENSSVKLLVDIPDIIPPVTPTGLTAEADTGVIQLKWLPVKDEELMGYIVYRKINNKNTLEYTPLNATPLSEEYYFDSLPLMTKNKFLYKVSAVDSSYNVSEMSDAAGAQMPDIFPPHKPIFSKTYVQESSIVVEWIPNMELDLLGYNIYRQKENDSSQAEQLNVKMLSPKIYRFTDRFAEAGVTYMYKLSVSDSTGNTAYSDLFRGAVLEFAEKDSSEINKIDIKYSGRNKSVRISGKISQNENYKGCVIYKQVKGKTFRPITPLIQEVQYKDKDIKPGETYYYQLKIYDNTGKIGKSGIIEIIIPE